MSYSALSGYRIMWVMALFDLPVLTKGERRRATRFRNFLLDEGFTMMQFSCYIRFTGGKEQAEALAGRIGSGVPEGGKVDILFFTDRQYENVHSYRGKSNRNRPPKPEQLQLF